MKLLLDTHTFLWFINGDSKLSNYVKQLIENKENKRFLSIASLWEMSIKVNLGKLKLNLTFQKMFNEHIEGNAIKLLNIKPKHLDVLNLLPFYHKDPFDRLIIAQSQSENISILSKDKMFKDYNDINLIW